MDIGYHAACVYSTRLILILILSIYSWQDILVYGRAIDKSTNITNDVNRDKDIVSKTIPIVNVTAKIDKVPKIPHDRSKNVEEFDQNLGDRDSKLEEFVQKHHMEQGEEKLKINDLGIDDHMDAVKLELDGHLNEAYKREVLFGDAGAGNDPHENQMIEEKLLVDTFNRADSDGDQFLTMQELEKWIQKRVEEHLLEAKADSYRIFRTLDADHDGYVKWNEYIATFKKLKEMEDHVDHMDGDKDRLGHSGPEENVYKYKRKWENADKMTSDGRLNLQEFVAFKHPEQSEHTMDMMVQDLLDQLDVDKNEKISLHEFVNMADDTNVDDWKKLREKEFTNVLDANHDHEVTRDELKQYVDPKHPKHAREEAEALIKMMDDDHDGKLELQEVLTNRDVFLYSKMINVEAGLHDEF